MIITPGGKQDICFANIASPGGDFIFHKKRKRRNGKREESLPKNVFFYSFRVLILFVVRFLLKVARDSSNLEEMLCGLWVLSTSVCVARSPVDFCSATTEAERRPLVFSVPIPLRTQRAKAPTRRKEFLLICGTKKLEQIFIDE